MPAPSLYDLAKARLVANIHMLDDIGDLPYDFLAPILKHIQNPSQLLDIEANCPQLLGETGEIWLRFIKRDIPNWDTKPHQPRDPKNWSKVYRKLKRDAENEKKEQEEQLKQQMRALQKDRDVNKTQIVDASRIQVPRPSRPWGFGGGGGGGGWEKSGAPAKTGKAAFDKLRRGMFDQKQARPKATRMPTHLLEQRKGKVAQAPARMVRMNEAEAPSRMVLSKGASASVAQGSGASSRPTLHSSPEKPLRASLPVGQQFTAPKIRPQSSGAAPPPKRKREEVNLFMQPKRSKP
jgi:elongin-A